MLRFADQRAKVCFSVDFVMAKQRVPRSGFSIVLLNLDLPVRSSGTHATHVNAGRYDLATMQPCLALKTS
ncbi:hypothetical protein QF000_000029 [Paraburkholderia atlantica]|uniref:Uncharacterized protein n=2 Tax=Paraburkholderia TaxID=1822464 RepID=A0A7W8P855_9BURK|nr:MULTISPECIES: hypothetical protein [Paraburkholderia]MBB5405343.1 hypothetical protein [Paraburkholderia youngii]MBB5421779.1 hypothetical protein [Paraburkholderia atlantica]MBB5429793.1 hypothetical protein [Paraburkholderia atlantica]MPW11646.1 hypothetical protein [Paraburkholderia atlantica]NUY35878.1 hypothetical protein [Paraburkholderia atlantica]